jgi:hypothetical protein
MIIEYILLNMYLCLNAMNKIASNNHNGGKCNAVNINDDNIREIYNNDTYKLSDMFSKNIKSFRHWSIGLNVFHSKWLPTIKMIVRTF